MERARVLVVDDERPLVALVGEYLRRDGFEVLEAFDGPTGLETIQRERPDVVVLDLMLPGLDGVELCRRVRASDQDPYVLMLTAKSDEIDRVVGLSVGADDYVTKPFSPRELVARVKALLRRPRAAATSAEPLRVGDVELDSERRAVTRAGAPVELTRIEFDLLAALLARPGVVWTREQLLERVWGGPWFGDDHLVDVHVANLRRKLGDDASEPRYIETVRGVGYRLAG